MKPTSWIELSRSALGRNIRHLKKRIEGSATYTSVIKGRAYGHGIEVFVPLAEECGVRDFAVFSADEAYSAHQARTRDSRIAIMGFINAAELEWAVAHDVALWVHDLRRPEWALQATRKLAKPARLHLEIETGMHRTGLAPEDLESLLPQLIEHREQLLIAGICTHLAGAESSANYLRIRAQLERFDAACDQVRAAGLDVGQRHVASSAALLSRPDLHMDRVRVGIAQYGFWPSLECKMGELAAQSQAGKKRPADPFKRVLSWKSLVMATHEVGRGEYVGYGNSFLTTRPTTVAIVPVGYAHGFGRNLSNLGHVLIRGRRAPVVGNVGMNMTTVDVTDTPGARQDDEVVLIGRQGRHEITVSSFAEMSQHVNYEMLTRLPAEIPREVVA